MRAAGLDVDAHFITKPEIDGKPVINSGHQIGDRTRLLMHFAGKYLAPDSEQMCRLTAPNYFERRVVIVYPTSHGQHTISYAGEVPTLTFTAAK